MNRIYASAFFMFFILATWPQAQEVRESEDPRQAEFGTNEMQVQAEFTSFDAPNSERGTFVVGILSNGKILGYTLDANQFVHGFVRDADGRITMIDAGGSEPSSLTVQQGTMPLAMNLNGVITGSYCDRGGISHGFIRSRKGDISLFDVPSLDGHAVMDTIPTDISETGTIAGYVIDTNYVDRVFLRHPDGEYEFFELPAVPDPLAIFPAASVYPATFYGMSASGLLIGVERDAEWNFHGWLRYPDGRVTLFDDPTAPTGFRKHGTSPIAINPAGAIVGTFADEDWHLHGFLRSPAGTFSTIDAPGAETTVPAAISPRGVVVGSAYYPVPAGTTGLLKGFLRNAEGSFSVIDAPEVVSVHPSGVNAEGTVTGYFWANENYHGFVWKARPTL